MLGYVVPALASDWGLEKAAFGPVFSANLLGWVLIYASLTVLMVFAHSLTTLMAARFICGIGMGDLLCQLDPAVFHDQLVAVAAAGKWPGVE